MTSLRVEGLTQRIGGATVLEDVTFEAAPGEVLSVIGPSGSGKTTLFRSVLGELEPDAGSIRIDGRDMTHVPVEKRGVGIVYQGYALFPHLTAAENIAFGLRARGDRRERVERRVAEMLAMVRLEGKGHQAPGELSGGERQRVALARALAVEPRILLLDEAFAALDAHTRSGVVHEVRGMLKELGVTTLLVTHDQEEAFLFARKVVVLNQGRVVTVGRSEEVMAHPDEFVQSFVKMVLFARAKVQEGPGGGKFVLTKDGARIPIAMDNVQPGDEVHVMVKKGPGQESVGVWRLDGP